MIFCVVYAAMLRQEQGELGLARRQCKMRQREEDERVMHGDEHPRRSGARYGEEEAVEFAASGCYWSPFYWNVASLHLLLCPTWVSSSSSSSSSLLSFFYRFSCGLILNGEWGSGGASGGGQVAKDALGNDVVADAWLANHGPGDRTLTQGLKVILIKD